MLLAYYCHSLSKLSTAACLRRVFVVGVIVFVGLFYWNQTRLQEETNNLEVKSLDRYDQTPVESHWTYKCKDDRCVRSLYENTTMQRVSFMSCSMLCGDINIWPYPTKEAVISKKSLKFCIDDLEFDIDAPNKEISIKLKIVFRIFRHNLRRIRGRTIRLMKLQNGQLPSCGDIDRLLIKVSVHNSEDMRLSLDTDENYQLNSNFEAEQLIVNISAHSFFGARHALSTLQQLIWYDDVAERLRTYTAAFISDAPKFRYRGLMLDTARHFFSVDSIKRTISAMALSKLNRFHWHITDSQSFPYISQHFPELAKYGAYSEREMYSQSDVSEIVKYAALHGIQVIPEIDAPAHAGSGWDFGPKRDMGDLNMCANRQPWRNYCGEPPCGQLNPKNKHTLRILERLYAELIQLTDTTDYFHLGGSDVNLDCWVPAYGTHDLMQVWCDFMIEAFMGLTLANNRNTPKYVTVWSSVLANSICLPKNQFTVQIWNSSRWNETQDIIMRGYNVILSHIDAWYLDCGFGSRKTDCTYHTWQNVYKHRPWARMDLNEQRMKQILGGEACLWTEQVDERQLDSRLWPRSAAFGERLWSDPADGEKILPQAVVRRMSLFRNRLVELDIKAEAILSTYCEKNPGECI